MQRVILLIISLFFASPVFSNEADHILNFNNGEVKALINWKVGPFNEKESVMEVQLKSNQELLPTPLKVSLFMPTMGHGSSPTKVDKIPGTNSFRVSKVYFSMPGTWEVRVGLKASNGAWETQAFSINI